LIDDFLNKTGDHCFISRLPCDSFSANFWNFVNCVVG
jgi:hypothetical protein